MKLLPWIVPLLVAAGCGDTAGGRGDDMGIADGDMAHGTVGDMSVGRDGPDGSGSVVDGGNDAGGMNGDDLGKDGGADMAPMPVYKVQSGNYTVSDLVQLSDACGDKLSTMGPNAFATVAVFNDGAGTLKLGDLRTPTGAYPQYDPQGYSQGAGWFVDLYHGTTTLATTVSTDGAGTCRFGLSRTNVVTVTADNRLDIDFTETQTSHAAGCLPVNVDCTSHYTYTLSR
jgi:hypothetical protein